MLLDLNDEIILVRALHEKCIVDAREITYAELGIDDDAHDTRYASGSWQKRLLATDVKVIRADRRPR